MFCPVPCEVLSARKDWCLAERDHMGFQTTVARNQRNSIVFSCVVGGIWLGQKLKQLMMTFDRWCEHEEEWESWAEGEGYTILAASGQFKYAWRRGVDREREREQEGEEKTGKQSEGNALQGSVKQRESSWEERRRRLNKRDRHLLGDVSVKKKKERFEKILTAGTSFFSCSISKWSRECAKKEKTKKS